MEFMAGYYTPHNQALNPTIRTERPYPIVTVQHYLERALGANAIQLNLKIEEITTDIRMIVIGNVFEWAMRNGDADFEGNMRRSLSHYLDSILSYKRACPNNSNALGQAFIFYIFLDFSAHTSIASIKALLNPAASSTFTASIVVPAGEHTISFNSPGCFPVSRTIFALPITAFAANLYACFLAFLLRLPRLPSPQSS